MAFMSKPSRRVEWTSERIAALTTPDIKQLRLNAERLNEPEIVERCDAVLKARPRGTGPGTAKPGVVAKPAAVVRRRASDKKVAKSSEVA
jgi:hypothetical protein